MKVGLSFERKRKKRKRSRFCPTLLMDDKNLVGPLKLEIGGKLDENKSKLR